MHIKTHFYSKVPFPIFQFLNSSTSYVWDFLYLTANSRLFLEILTVAKPAKKFRYVYETRMFITALTTFCFLTLPWTARMQSTSPRTVSFKKYFNTVRLEALKSLIIYFSLLKRDIVQFGICRRQHFWANFYILIQGKIFLRKRKLFPIRRTLMEQSRCHDWNRFALCSSRHRYLY